MDKVKQLVKEAIREKEKEDDDLGWLFVLIAIACLISGFTR